MIKIENELLNTSGYVSPANRERRPFLGRCGNFTGHILEESKLF